MSTSPIRRVLSLAAVAALTLAVAACGSESGPDAPTTPTDAAVTEEGTTEPEAEPVADTRTAPEESAGDAGSDPTAGPGAACELLDSDAIESITGEPYGDVEPTGVEAEAQSTCEWSIQGGAIVQILVLNAAGPAIAEQRATIASMYDDVADADVEGAPEAFSYFGGLTIGMADGGDYITVTYISSTDAETADITEALAEEVIANR